MAFDWAKTGCPGEHCKRGCRHSFPLAFLLHASHLKSASSVAEAIQEHLFPADNQPSIDALNRLMKSTPFVLIVDAFDEAAHQNFILNQIIEKKLLKHATVVITSRFNFLQSKLEHFDKVYSIEGFNEDQQLLHVKKFAQQVNKPIEHFHSFLDQLKKQLRDLACNPLNLTLLLLLFHENQISFHTRTLLYNEIHHFIVRKASERMKMSEDDIEEKIIRALCRASFEAFNKNQVVFHAQDIGDIADDVLKVGYLTREFAFRGLREEERYAFPHRSFYEYLSAKHLLTTPDHLHVFIQAMQEDFDHWRSVAFFVVGLAGNREEDRSTLLKVVEAIMTTTRFSQQRSLSGHSPCHAILEALNELSHLTPSLEEAIMKQIPECIGLDDDCSSACWNGAVMVDNMDSLKGAEFTLKADDVDNDRLRAAADLQHLRVLRMQLKNPSEEEAKQLKRLLKKNTLEELHLDDCDFNDHMKDALTESFSSMTSLQHIEFRRSIDVKSLKHLHHLRSFRVDEVELTDADVDGLSAAITSWSGIQGVSMRRCHLKDVSRENRRKLFQAMSTWQEVVELWLYGMDIEDADMGEVCSMLTQMKRLKSLNLQWNPLTQEGLRMLRDCLADREEKIDELRVLGNPGYHEVREELRKVCNRLY